MCVVVVVVDETAVKSEFAGAEAAVVVEEHEHAKNAWEDHDDGDASWGRTLTKVELGEA